MTCKKCNREVPAKYISCMGCLEDAAKREQLRRIGLGKESADTYTWDSTTHIYAPHGRVQAATPASRYAACGVQPRRADKIEAYRRGLVDAQQLGVCRACIDALR